MQRNAIIFLLAYLFCNDSLSQQYPFIDYTPKDGLVNNRARFMFQNSKGLLYIATFGGLSVYDGSRFTNYTISDGITTTFGGEAVPGWPGALAFSLHSYSQTPYETPPLEGTSFFYIQVIRKYPPGPP